MSATVRPCSESVASGAEPDLAIKRSYCIPIAGHCQLMLKRACATRLAAERGPLDWPLPDRLFDTVSSVPQIVRLAACPGHGQRALCPLRARSAGQSGYLADTHGLAEIPPTCNDAGRSAAHTHSQADSSTLHAPANPLAHVRLDEADSSNQPVSGPYHEFSLASPETMLDKNATLAE
jgi:hypothetical protein